MRIRYLLILCFLCRIVQLSADIQYQQAKIFNSLQGLSNLKINSIVQDKKGYIWVATEDGLNRFDGYSFTVYHQKDNDSTSLTNNYITTLCYDSGNRLWIGTLSGLQYYDDQSECFVKQRFEETEDSTSQDSYNWIMEDSRKNIWFSIDNRGVLKYSPQTGESVLYLSIADGGELCSKYVRHIAEDKAGNIWFTSFDNGLSVWNVSTNAFAHYNQNNSDLPTNSVLRIMPLRDGRMLISTLGNGLYTLDHASGKIERMAPDITAFAIEQISDDAVLIGTEGEGLLILDVNKKALYPHPAIPRQRHDMVNSKIHYIVEDKNGNLWLGMFNDGLCYLQKEPDGFTRYKRDFDHANSLSYGQVTGIVEDKQGNIYFSTDGGGLNYYHRTTGQYTHYKHDVNNPSSLPDDAVVSVFCDSRGKIWAGTYIGGLCTLDESTGTFKSYRHTKDAHSLPGDYVRSITEDKQQNLWIGTEGNGISYFNPRTETFTNYSATQYPGFISDYVTMTYLQGDHTLWIGSYSGICRLHIESQTFESYNSDPLVKNLFIFSIVEDTAGHIWVGTSSGLYTFDAANNRFEIHDLSAISKRNLSVNGIVSYPNELWLSTNEGIVCYLPKHRQVKKIINNNDLGGIAFLRSSYYKSPQNEIFFGGANGCYSFFPDKMDLNEYAPKVYITGLDIFNEPITVGKPHNGRILLGQSLEYTDELVLKYSENTFTIRFTSPTALYPASISYMCQLEGADKQWVSFPSTLQSVTYANLSPGTYTFQIYASNIPGYLPDNITSLTLRVLPPLWLTWWAKLAYVVLTIGLFVLVFRVIYGRMKDRNALQMEKMKAKKQEELNQSKMQFFTNISHEFRTPLTLIISPLKDMYEQESDSKKAYAIKMILRNANRLLQLINQILDLRKAENNHIDLHVQPIDLELFITHFIEFFSDTLERKKITLSTQYITPGMVIWYDPDLLEKCLYNLFSNALKFTPEGGRIHIGADRSDTGTILLRVEDNGCGIHKKEIPYLFDRFYLGEFSASSGTGIGLHFVKTIVELHKGKVTAEGEEGVGSIFTIHIPEGNKHFDAAVVNETPWLPENTNRKPIEPHLDRDENLPEEFPWEKITDGKNKPTVLLVEDEYDMRAYIHQELSPFYQVIETNNGREALSKLQTIEPDLIVSDIMMPEMNGIDFCRIVKENMDTCHIPVILLTANQDIEQQFEGLETGADSYIIKPFHIHYLRIRIRKLLEMRKKMQAKFNKLLNAEPQEIEAVNPDEVLLQKCMDYIRANLSDTDLSVENMAKEMFISRAHLHRKIKVLTGNSPIELIKILRMKQAAYLLETGTQTIAEVAYQTGFNSPSYFSRRFNDYWGVYPTVYVQNLRSEKE
ncbi:two-component regulator propeller domain-containing protein [Parabacteroides sp. PF5-6]|uniref:two-component regulator propeller domain-containing protein n=1 Tax=Parabacteroides sp. PF5-6 TaxID=1742403 RepID=UPI002406BEB6|nr:two-component regulator propeller domain-containing protein [Parabacteroides sp. PF5-6]MDF9828816.1 signal transduction histidine kinase/ligand-binding sensor domain-containing protein/DNA-binding response OmpR family regulator [Parabacteroides sp. PF5-6]